MGFSILRALLIFSISWSTWSNSLPKDWNLMEIESKWTIDQSQYRDLINDFEDGKYFDDYQLKVRWKGVPKLFIDDYYDFPDNGLALEGHALRHRTRLTVKDSNDVSSIEWSELEDAKWKKDWERIQYKSTPYRDGAIWFRYEAGDCLVWSKKKNDKKKCHRKKKVSVKQYLRGDKKHPALEYLVSDHSDLDLRELSKVLEVVDYRYRIEFYKNGELKFELSLDQLEQTDLRDMSTYKYYEAELEILEENFNEQTLNELRVMVNKIQNQYGLNPSTHSKSGIYVNEVSQ